METTISTSHEHLPGRNRARLVVLLSGLSAVVALLLILLGVLHALDVSGAEEAAAVLAEEEMNLTTVAFLLANGLQILLTLATFISLLVWVYRAFRNLVQANINTEYTPGWAVGWFLIPIANLVMPYRAVRELWHRSGSEVEEPGIFNAPEPAPLLAVWWGVWVVNTILGNIGGRIYDNAETGGQLSIGTWVITLSNVLEVAAALLTIWLVQNVMRRQTSNPALTPQHQSPPPPPDFTMRTTDAAAPRAT